MPELIFLRRGSEVLRLTLGAERVVLGRGEQCDVVLPDPDISRVHLALQPTPGGGCAVEDLSGKGLQVLGQKVSNAILTDGADIALGQWRALYRESAREDEPEVTEAGQRTELQPALGQAGPRIPVQVRVRSGGQESLRKLQADEFLVGADDGADLLLKHRFISGKHLKVTRHDNRFHLVDQASTNGTWVGPLRIFEADVPFFTSVRLGETELTLEPQGMGAQAGVSNYQGIIGADAAVKQLAELVERVAPSAAAVTVLGESGTGKELVARAIHARSPRAQAAFIPVNCAAISKELIESELFGHEKGAFTGALAARKGAFEEADGGTLFLDEIGELPLELQAKLLRALESGEIKRVGAPRPITVDVRIVAATNRELLQAAREGRFREDLYYRLCVIPLHLPPLRNRPGDVQHLAEHFLKQFTPRGQTVTLTPAALERLKAHPWPGNVRELRNVIHRALLLRRQPQLDAADLTFDEARGSQPAAPVAPAPSSVSSGAAEAFYQPGQTLEQMLAQVERQLVELALSKFNNNRERVARELGVARSTLFKRLKDWGLTGDDA